MKAKRAFLKAAKMAPGLRTRRWLCRLGGATLGSSVWISPRVTFRQGVSLGDGVRVLEYSYLECVRLGKNSVVERGAVLRGTEKHFIDIGNECFIGPGAYLDGSGGLRIGDFVQLVGVGTCIWTHSTVMQALQGAPLISSALREEAPVSIGNRVWIGSNVTINPGVEIGDETVVLSHSVVTKDVSPRTMVGGIPASVKREISISDGGVEFL